MFTNDEINLMCIYNTGTREGLIAELTQMRGYLSAEEAELLALTDSALGKLRNMRDEEYASLELFPDFDEEAESQS
ncbi:MAG: transposon-transfer assisting family protein [bacterium]